MQRKSRIDEAFRSEGDARAEKQRFHEAYWQAWGELWQAGVGAQCVQ